MRPNFVNHPIDFYFDQSGCFANNFWWNLFNPDFASVHELISLTMSMIHVQIYILIQDWIMLKLLLSVESEILWVKTQNSSLLNMNVSINKGDTMVGHRVSFALAASPIHHQLISCQSLINRLILLSIFNQRYTSKINLSYLYHISTLKKCFWACSLSEQTQKRNNRYSIQTDLSFSTI